jgi:hypothetical protein
MLCLAENTSRKWQEKLEIATQPKWNPLMAKLNRLAKSPREKFLHHIAAVATRNH